MSEHTKDNKALMATPESAMYSYLTDCRIPKNEYEHYAGRKILNLEEQLAERDAEIERLESRLLSYECVHGNSHSLNCEGCQHE